MLTTTLGPPPNNSQKGYKQSIDRILWYVRPFTLPRYLKPCREYSGQHNPSKHDTLTQCWAAVGPPSTTLGQHQTIIGSTCRVCWDITTVARQWVKVGQRLLVAEVGDKEWGRHNLPGSWVTRAKAHVLSIRIKHETLSQCYVNDGPPSATLVQHLNSIGSTYHVFRVWSWSKYPSVQRKWNITYAKKEDSIALMYPPTQSTVFLYSTPSIAYYYYYCQGTSLSLLLRREREIFWKLDLAS